MCPLYAGFTLICMPVRLSIASAGDALDPPRPVRRRDARVSVSFIVHCRRFPTTKSTVETTGARVSEFHDDGISTAGFLLPQMTTVVTMMMMAMSPPLLRVKALPDEPDAPALVSTGEPLLSYVCRPKSPATWGDRDMVTGLRVCAGRRSSSISKNARRKEIGEMRLAMEHAPRDTWR